MAKGFIHREKHNKNYTVLANTMLFDEKLTDTAIVLIARILSIDDGKWDWSKEGLRAKVKMKPYAFNSAFKLLKELGYIVMEEKRKANGQNCYEWHIYENPYVEEPHVNNQEVGEQAQLNINNQNNKKLSNNALNINHSISEERLNEVAENFKKQIDFDVLERRFGNSSPVEKRILVELTDLAIEVLQSKNQTYRIGREDKTRAVVESCLKKLTCESMEQTVHNIFSYDKEISDPFAFNLTALYKASLTSGTQSNAKVNSEISEEKEWAEAV